MKPYRSKTKVLAMEFNNENFKTALACIKSARYNIHDAGDYFVVFNNETSFIIKNGQYLVRHGNIGYNHLCAHDKEFFESKYEENK